MNKEIEVRFLEIDKNELIKKLTKLGAIDNGETTLNEIIFYDPELSWLKERRFVRLRTIGNITNLTYKSNKDQTVDSAYEVEFSITEPQEAVKFLEGIGLVAYRHQEKKRHTFVAKDIVIDIDTWPKIPTYVEFEGPSEESLKNFSKLLGFSWSSAVFDDARGVIEKHYNIPIGEMKWFTFKRWE
ncbi:MAG: CYTH domain-containing protein [Patescibacteria group bacterium]